MSNRGSARALGRAFTLIECIIPCSPERAALVIALWEDARSGDFHFSQMNCDAALIKLGLARKLPVPKYPDETEMNYGPLETSEKKETSDV